MREIRYLLFINFLQVNYRGSLQIVFKPPGFYSHNTKKGHNKDMMIIGGYPKEYGYQERTVQERIKTDTQDIENRT